MIEILHMLFHVFELIATWTIVLSLTAPVVWAWYCFDHRGDE